MLFLIYLCQIYICGFMFFLPDYFLAGSSDFLKS